MFEFMESAMALVWNEKYSALRCSRDDTCRSQGVWI